MVDYPMLSRLAGDLVVVVHFLFIVFVVLGGLLVLRWPRLVYLHIPAALWGALVEIQGWICPLTPLEFHFRQAAGHRVYHQGFVDHYILPLVYPSGLTREVQIVLGVLVLAVNIALYAFIFHRKKLKRDNLQH